MVEGFPEINKWDLPHCEACALAKQTKAPISKEPASFGSHLAARPHLQDMGRSTESPFTAELPQEMKLLLGGPPGMEMTGFGQDLGQDMYGQPFMSMDSHSFYNTDMTGVNKLGELEQAPAEMYGADEDWDFMAQAQAAAPGMDEPWDTFINDSAWDTNVQ